MCCVRVSHAEFPIAASSASPSAMEHHAHCDHHHCQCTPSSTTETTLELDFARSLCGAASMGDIGKVRTMLGRGRSVKERDSSGYTALHYAARSGNMELCRLLVLHHAEIDPITTSNKTTPLHRAAMMGHLDVCLLLMDNNACLVTLDADKESPFMKACKNDHRDVAIALWKAGNEEDRRFLLEQRNKRGQDVMELTKEDVKAWIRE